jgi:hypothetical protein
VAVAAVACEPGPVVPLNDTEIDTDEDRTIDGGNGAPWVCDQIEQNGTCTEYTGNAWDGDLAQQDCATGTFQTAWFCPPATLGICTMGAGQGLEQTVSYYLGEWLTEDAADAVESNCLFAEGSWQPVI